MYRRPTTQDDFDSPWKEALQRFLRAFLGFFFPHIEKDIDWSRGYEALDKEFQKIARKAKVGKRLADKLFKVWLEDGAEHWLLIHIEIQGDVEQDFPERMLAYNLAARLLYNRTVVSLAVLCDERPAWRPASCSYGHWGYRTEVSFGIAKLLDYGEDLAALEASDNPFASIVLAHLQTQRTRRDPETRKQWKLRLVKGLYRRQWSKEEMRELFFVIDWIMALPDDVEDVFQAELLEFEKEHKMPWISSIERVGIRKGREEGREEGLREGLLEGIDGVLEAKFGAAGRKLLTKAGALASVKELRHFARFLKKADSLEQVRKYFE